MSKYWLVCALFCAVGCSGGAVDAAGATQDKVTDGDGKTTGDPNSDPKGTAGGTAAPGSADCSSELDAIAQEIAALTDKYGALKESCAGTGTGDPGTKPDPGTVPPKGDPGTVPPKGDPGTVPPKGDPCGPALDAVTAYLDEATKSGDVNQMIAAKEKYVAVLNSCQPANPEAPPKK